MMAQAVGSVQLAEAIAPAKPVDGDVPSTSPDFAAALAGARDAGLPTAAVTPSTVLVRTFNAKQPTLQSSSKAEFATVQGVKNISLAKTDVNATSLSQHVPFAGTDTEAVVPDKDSTVPATASTSGLVASVPSADKADAVAISATSSEQSTPASSDVVRTEIDQAQSFDPLPASSRLKTIPKVLSSGAAKGPRKSSASAEIPTTPSTMLNQFAVTPAIQQAFPVKGTLQTMTAPAITGSSSRIANLDVAPLKSTLASPVVRTTAGASAPLKAVNVEMTTPLTQTSGATVAVVSNPSLPSPVLDVVSAVNGPVFTVSQALSASAPISHGAVTSTSQSAVATESKAMQDLSPSLISIGMHATSSSLEVGLASGSHGWLKIRAELTETGAVKASLTGNSNAAVSKLQGDLPALSSFLQSEKVQVASLAVHSALPMSSAAPPQVAAMSSFGSDLSNLADRGTGGGAAQSGQGQAELSNFGQGKEGDGESSAMKTDPLLSEGSIEAENFGTASLPGYTVSGSWLNVRA